MILVTFSVVVTIGVLNVNFRTPATHKVNMGVGLRMLSKTDIKIICPRYSANYNYMICGYILDGTMGAEGIH